MGNRWYVALGGQEVGPLSDTGLERMIQGGRIEGDALVRNGVAGEWTAAREVEPILAARPGRRRPGEEAIEAARRAKYQQQQLLQQQQPPLRPAAPASRIELSPADPSSADPSHVLQPPAAKSAVHPTVAVTEDILPAPDDLPLAQPRDAARSTGGAPILAPYVVAPGDAEAATPKRRSLYFFVAIGAGLLVVVAAIGSAAWFVFGGGLSSNSSPPQTLPSAIDPQLAELRRQAEQLRRDLAEAKQKLEAQPQPAKTSPAEKSEISETSAAKDESSGATDRPLAENPGAKSVANEPDAKSMASVSEAKPMPAPVADDLEGDRAALAVMLASERVANDERERLHQVAAKFESTLEFDYEPDTAVAFAKRFLEAEAEVAKLDVQELADKQQQAKSRLAVRRKEAARLLAEAKQSAECIELRPAILKAVEGGTLMPADDIEDSTTTFIRELPNALPSTVFGVLNEKSDAEITRLLGVEQLPSDWPDRVTDPTVAEALRKSFVRLVPLVNGFRQLSQLTRQLEEAKASIDLTKLRTILLLHAASGENDDGEITTAEILSLIDIYGVCSVNDLPPPLDGAISKRSVELLTKDRVEFLFGVAQGKIKVETFGDIYQKSCKAAGDAWPPDDRPHPLAGRWKGKANWELEIDPRRNAIVYRCSSPEAAFEQRICKIGRDHVVAYEKRKLPLERVATDPFRTEKYNDDDHLPGADDPLPDEVIAFTYYSLEKGGQVLEMRRRIMPASLVQESVGREFWQLLSKPKKYREFRAVYRRVKE